jgi:hypothetical protein
MRKQRLKMSQQEKDAQKEKERLSKKLKRRLQSFEDNVNLKKLIRANMQRTLQVLMLKE